MLNTSTAFLLLFFFFLNFFFREGVDGMGMGTPVSYILFFSFFFLRNLMWIWVFDVNNLECCKIRGGGWEGGKEGGRDALF